MRKSTWQRNEANWDKTQSGLFVDFLRRELKSSWPSVRFEDHFFERMELYWQLLREWGQKFNLVSRCQDPKFVALHVSDSVAPLALDLGSHGIRQRFLAEGVKVADIGSGAGFPGIVLACLCNGTFVLFEPRRKRAGFLRVVARHLGLSNVIVREERITNCGENAASDEKFDVAVGRAVSPLPVFCELSYYLLRPLGVAIFFASEKQAEEFRLAQYGGLNFVGLQQYVVGASTERTKASDFSVMTRHRRLLYFEKTM